MNPEQRPQGNSQQNPLAGQQFVNYGSDKQNTPPVSNVIPQRQIPVTPPMARYSAPKKSHKGLFFTLFIILIIILALAYAAYAWVMRPDHVVQTIFNNITSAEVISANLKIDATSEKGESYAVTALIDLDKSNPNAFKTQTTIDVTTDKFTAGFELRYLNNKIYSQITNYPTEYAAVVKSFANKWYSLTVNKTQGSSPVNTEDLYKKVIESGAFTGIHFAGFAWGTNGLVRNYTIDVNPEVFNPKNTAQYTNGLSQSVLPYAGAATSYAGNLLGKAKVNPIMISVGMFDGSLKQISLSASDEKSPAKTDVILKYDDSKSSISIDTPSEAQPLEPIIASFFSPVQDSATGHLKGKDARVKADISNMRVVAEDYYNKNKTYVGACTSSNAKAVTSDIKAQQSSLTCSATKTVYVMYAVLPSSTSSPIYYCADSTAVMKELTKAPKGIACN